MAPKPLSQPPERLTELVFLGGGHSHALALRELIRQPLPRTRVTLVSATVHTPYSGMIPGLVAGHYDFKATHIDLSALCQAAGITWLQAVATGLAPQRKQLLFADREPLSFDLLSLDTGSTPSFYGIPGAEVHTIPVKPIAGFLPRWEALIQRALAAPEPLRLAVVGAGAAGVELTLAMEHHLSRAFAASGREGQAPRFEMFFSSPEILCSHPPRLRRQLTKTLKRRGIVLHGNTAIAAVEAHKLVTAQGAEHPVDETFWLTQASPAPWLAKSGLTTDESGFVAVDACFRSVSHPHVYATGDVATVLPHPREKAGVFAVRQGLPLAQNLRRAVAGDELQPYLPPHRFLSLISLGDHSAVASYGPLSCSLGRRLIWRWKNHIDRSFMALFPGPPP